MIDPKWSVENGRYHNDRRALEKTLPNKMIGRMIAYKMIDSGRKNSPSEMNGKMFQSCHWTYVENLVGPISLQFEF